MFYQLNYARINSLYQAESAESQNRTGDTAIFSRVLYQLSYLGLMPGFLYPSATYFTHM